MNVGLFAANILSPDSGGGYTIENEILNAISKNASKSCHQFTIYSNSNYSLNNIASTHPVLKHRIKGLKTKVQNIFKRLPLMQSDSFCEMIKENNPDVIFFLTPWAHFDVDIPYISIVWDLQHRLQPHFPEVSANGEYEGREKIYSKILPCASIIITGTEAGKKEVEKFYSIPSERIRILAHPTPDWALKESKHNDNYVKEKYNIKKEYLFYPAQFWQHKNHINLIKSLKILNFEYKCDFELVFAGSDKGNKSIVQDFVSNNDLIRYVHFLGFVNRKDMIELYQNAFALTYVSLFGPENMPPLEGFALGCPVIASNVSGAEEQLADAAILINGNNPREIADAILALKKNNELRNELIQKGRIRANKWTSKDFVLDLFKILDEFEKNVS